MQPWSLLAGYSQDSRDYTDQSGKNMDSQHWEESGRFEQHLNPVDVQWRLPSGAAQHALGPAIEKHRAVSRFLG
jgi:hypothetical protein